MQQQTGSPQEDEGLAAEPLVIVMRCPLMYALSGPGGAPVASGEAEARLDAEKLTIVSKAGVVLELPYREMLQVTAGDYRLHGLLVSQERVELSRLGFKYEDFLKSLIALRNEVLLKDMLMQESLRKPGVAAAYLYEDATFNQRHEGACHVRVYDTGLVVLPDLADPIRITYSDIAAFTEEDYVLRVTTEYGEALSLSRLGHDFTPLSRALAEAIGDLAVRAQTMLKELAPSAPSTVIRTAAQHMLEGRAVTRRTLEAISPDLWSELERRVAASPAADSYAYLKSLSRPDRVAIGFKRGLMGDLTGDYLWFLIPIYSTDSAAPGNALAMEAISDDGTGMATYFFRLVGRAAYPGIGRLDELDAKVDALISRVNRAMQAVNFRREPIYLTDRQLADPKYMRYLFTMQRVRALRELRSRFIGRVIHRLSEQWQRDVLDLLKFHVSTIDDAARWSRRS